MLCLKQKNILEVDGGVNPLNVKNLVQSGANLIVAGNAIFKDGKDFYEKYQSLKVPRVKKIIFRIVKYFFKTKLYDYFIKK